MFLFKSLPILPLLFNCRPLATGTTEQPKMPDVKAKRMMRDIFCSNQVVSAEHRYCLLPVRSKIECAVRCRQDGRCVSLVYDQEKHLCHLANSRAFDNCSNMETIDQTQQKSVFYQQPPPCGEGGTLDAMGECVCSPGFNGTPCRRYFHDCNDWLKYGDWQGNGVYSVHPLRSSQSFKVHCRHITSARLYVMQKKKKKNRPRFDRPWSDYKNGFGDLEGDFWLGLEKLTLLTTTNRSYRLKMAIKLINDTVLVRSYENFKVSSETSGYRLSFNSSLLTDLNDCLRPLLNAPFSTYDHDVDDNEDVNCAQVRKGGFWFRGEGCSTCNPLGVIYGKSDGLLTEAADEAYWAFLGEAAPFKISMYLVAAEGV